MAKRGGVQRPRSLIWALYVLLAFAAIAAFLLADSLVFRRRPRLQLAQGLKGGGRPPAAHQAEMAAGSLPVPAGQRDDGGDLVLSSGGGAAPEPKPEPKLEPEPRPQPRKSGARWAVPWSEGADAAISPAPGAHLNATCQKKMTHFIMHKINGSSLTRTMSQHAKVFEVSPTVLLKEWGEERLADLFHQAQESWGSDGAHMVERLPQEVISSALQNQYWREFARFASKGLFEKSVLSTSSYALEQISAQAGAHASVQDPLPGMMIMYNARFWLQSVFVNDCKSVYASCCWGVGQDRNLFPPDDTCSPSSVQPKYDKVLSLKVHKQRYFYHIVLEGMIRLAPFADLLAADKSIQVAGLWALAKHKEIMSFLGLTGDRLLIGSGGGCANILIVPEHVPCEGPTRPMLHIMRGFIARAMRTFSVRKENVKDVIMLVKREGTTRRSVENHDELHREISQEFATHTIVVHTGKEPVHLQWEMFGRVTAAAGPHGAAWTSLVAMRPGAGVLEFLVHGHEINLCFFSSAMKLGLTYKALVPQDATHHGSMRVDIARAVSELKQILIEAEKAMNVI